jgi:hypothetical protein
MSRSGCRSHRFADSAGAPTANNGIPNQLGVAYDAHVIEAILTQVAPGIGWR